MEIWFYFLLEKEGGSVLFWYNNDMKLFLTSSGLSSQTSPYCLPFLSCFISALSSAISFCKSFSDILLGTCALKEHIFKKSPYVKMVIADKLGKHGLPVFRAESVANTSIGLLERFNQKS